MSWCTQNIASSLHINNHTAGTFNRIFCSVANPRRRVMGARNDCIQRRHVDAQRLDGLRRVRDGHDVGRRHARPGRSADQVERHQHRQRGAERGQRGLADSERRSPGAGRRRQREHVGGRDLDQRWCAGNEVRHVQRERGGGWRRRQLAGERIDGSRNGACDFLGLDIGLGRPAHVLGHSGLRVRL